MTFHTRSNNKTVYTLSHSGEMLRISWEDDFEANVSKGSSLYIVDEVIESFEKGIWIFIEGSIGEIRKDRLCDSPWIEC